MQHSEVEEVERSPSRKRRHDGQDIDAQEEIAEVAEQGPKRRRSSNWPLQKEESESAGSSSDLSKRRSPSANRHRVVSSESRQSKFREATMHDKPSEKPPSLFTRWFRSNAQDASLDRLMEDYHSSDAGDSTIGPARVKNGHQHGPHESAASASTHETKRSSVFRFGHSIAAKFNPVTIYKELAQNWKEATDDAAKELEEQQQRKRLMDEQKLKAEQTYAAMKKAGQLHAQNKPQPRDSGIDMGEDRPSVDFADGRQSTASLQPPTQNKSLFSFNTTSMTDLRVLRHKSTPSSSQSPEKPEFEHSVRKSPSKKDMQKQLKLTKRVSDLEEKLLMARRELHEVLGECPPVPPIPDEIKTMTPREPSPLKRAFTPGQLPSLPSERLLSAGQLEESTEGGGSAKSINSNGTVNRDVSATKGRAYKARKAGETAQTNKELPEVPALKNHKPRSTATANASDIWTEEASPPKVRETNEKRGNRKRTSDEANKLYKPSPDTDPDTEHEVVKHGIQKKRRTVAKHAPRTTSTSTAKGTAGKLTKQPPTQATAPESASSSFKENAAPSQEAEVVTETVHIKHQTTTLALNDVSLPRTTATATPAHPKGNPSLPVHSDECEEEIVVAKPANSVSELPTLPEVEAMVEKRRSRGEKEDWEWSSDIF